MTKAVFAAAEHEDITTPQRYYARVTPSALRDLETVDDPLIEVIGGLGIRLHTYLPTRTFELAVHGMDIARAVDLSFSLPTDVLAEAVELATRVAVTTGAGETVLLTLTGRTDLPPSFSVI